MTVESTSNKDQYLANAIQTSFPITFKFFDETSVKIYLENTLIDPLDYTISGDGSAQAGQVDFAVAPATGTLTIIRQITIKQALDLLENGDFSAESIEKSFDLLTLMVQDIKEENDRAVKLTVKNAGVSGALPDPVASTYMRWNAAADALELGMTQAEVDQIKADQVTLENTFQTLHDNTVADNNTTVTEITALKDQTTASETNAAASAVTAEEWANKTGATVDGLEYSAKHYAQEAAANSTENNLEVVANQAILANGQISPAANKKNQILKVSGSGGPQIASLIPFDVAPADSTVIRLMGTDALNTLEIQHNDAPGGIILTSGTEIVLGLYQSITLYRDAGLDRYIQLGRNL